ncbi:MAG: hypothetical protein TREMPRED_004659 [Tremellales sp. Tagirdzhanova-0007]|nr:MAG: hypothetical protein TREMPRED_004659 [Tremellales sp. Tagirdzhanova-0007]
MAPIATQTQTQTIPSEQFHALKLRGPSPPSDDTPGRSRLTEPLKYQGSLDKFQHFEVTPSIGREFGSDLQLLDLINAPNADELARELAALVSRRGVCFFRGQNISGADMLRLAAKISEMSGQPKDSGHVVHPIGNEVSELSSDNKPKTMEISAEKQRKGGGINRRFEDVSRWASVAWHSDVSFERVPADYSILKINTLPQMGGDTLWINTADILDRMSPSFREYLETLTCEHDANFFHEEARKLGISLNKGPRGNPLNVDTSFKASHPVVRTNPVTGWKSLFVNRGFSRRIEGVTKDESDMIMDYINRICMMNIDCQVRFRWEKGSIALWDNRSSWHTATFDYTEERSGERASTLGEVPYFDPKSKLRSESLLEEGLRV